MSGTLVPVRVRDCACPGSPHNGQDGTDDGDYVYLRPVLGYQGGLAVLAALGRIPLRADGTMDLGELSVGVSPLYIEHGAVGWNFTNGTGETVPFDAQVLLDDYSLAYPIGERADELYGEAVLRPLVSRTSKSSPRGRTGGSTSASRPSRSKRRSRSAPSLPESSAATQPSSSWTS